MRAVQRFLRIVLLFAISALASAVLAEGVCRWMFRDVTTTSQPSWFTFRWQSAHPDDPNSLGFREREFRTPAPAGSYRIAVIGDSFTYGQGIATSDRLTEILEQRLRAQSARYEVLNFGSLGASSADHLRILREAVLPSEPSYVLLQWFANDVEAEDTSGRPVPWRLLPSDRVLGLLHHRSAFYFLAKQAWTGAQEKAGIVESYVDYLEANLRDPQSPHSRESAALIEAFFATCRASGVPVGMVLFPILADVEGDSSRYPLGFAADRVLAACEQQGVSCVDLRPTFAPVQPVGKLWANRLDSHPSRFANELAAEAVLRVFSEQWGAPPHSTRALRLPVR